jgi:ABC-type glycerol-3-phosphate transport system substrate-binding protein
MKNNFFAIIALASAVSLAACGGDEGATAEGDGTVVDQSTEMVTTQDTTMMQTPVVTTDTSAVQTTTIVEADTTVRTDVVPAGTAPATTTP